ncbi:MAG: hypothetical protein HC819_22280 [Cyclobacteriaceae bacterium]|nr:hypothetical protein [Cyclobacteriaceae bacterium]
MIGGFAWKAQYVDKNGYIYTGDDAQYNLQTDAPAPYHAELAPVTKQFDCGQCHTTGYVSTSEGGAAQDGLAGMTGEFFAAGVQCEACHGMGSFHVNSRSASDIILDRTAKACATCHSRADGQRIAAADGFIMNYTQYDEMKAAKHQNLSCVDCHDPHVSVKHGETGGIVKACTTCHEGIKNPTHKGADCITCHMPHATKSAVAVNKYVADVQTHIFKINTSALGNMFSDNGTVANGAEGVTLGYVCYQCHKDDNNIGGPNSKKSLGILAGRAQGYHE